MFAKSLPLFAAALTVGGALFSASCNLSDSGAAVVDSNNTTNNSTNNRTNNAVNCGNGTLDPGETCDGDCPTCEDADPCTEDVITGSADTCDLVCSTTPITACVDGDMCCPESCSTDMDNDCACVPTTCESAGNNCGTLDDGCGQILDCGTCPSQESCLAGT